ncbi:MAG: hypothetical protein ACLRRT_08700 [Ruthenibacterium lactatiformans]
MEVIRAGVLKVWTGVRSHHKRYSFGVCGVLTSATDRFESNRPRRTFQHAAECIDPIVTGADHPCATDRLSARFSPRPGGHSRYARPFVGYNIILAACIDRLGAPTMSGCALPSGVSARSASIAASAGADVQVEYVRGYDSIRNDPALTGWARNRLRTWHAGGA